jgi:acetyltransferase-like isoleucine patch superfamily enzyme
MSRRLQLREWIERIANGVCLAIIGLPALTCWLEVRLNPRREGVFHFWSHIVAQLPGPPGELLRRAFYRLTLEECSAKFHVGFGSFFSHRRASVEDGVYIGPYAIVGAARLRNGTLVGTRASLLSAATLHELGEDGRWSSFDFDKLAAVEVGPHAWIGEGAIVMANIGARSMVAAGAVVSAAVPADVVVAGNPARFLRTRPVVSVTSGSHAGSTP